MTDEETARDYIKSVKDRHGLISWLDIEVHSIEEDTVVLTVPYNAKFANSTDSVQGGVIATLIDFASAMSFKTQFEDPHTVSSVTTNLNVSYLEPAESTIFATAKPVWIGSSTGVGTVVVESERSDDNVAFGTTTFRFFDR